MKLVTLSRYNGRLEIKELRAITRVNKTLATVSDKSLMSGLLMLTTDFSLRQLKAKRGRKLCYTMNILRTILTQVTRYLSVRVGHCNCYG
jgi:hypothetical protein